METTQTHPQPTLGELTPEALKALRKLSRRPWGLRAYIRADADAQALEIHEDYKDNRGIERSICHIFPIGGRMPSRVVRVFAALDGVTLANLIKAARAGDRINAAYAPDGGRNGYLENAGLTIDLMELHLIRPRKTGGNDIQEFRFWGNAVPKLSPVRDITVLPEPEPATA